MGKTEYKNRYAAEKYDRIPLVVKKGRKEELTKLSKESGYKSLNSFLLDAIEEKINSLKKEETI